MKQNRRDFIRTLGLAYGSILVVPSCLSIPEPYYRVFTKPEADCLIALCEQIIPADHDAGATDAGVIHFIDKQTSLRFPDDLKIYRQGIASLQAFCRAKYGKLFETLDVKIQVDIMKEMERNKLPEKHWPETEQSAFFSLVLHVPCRGFTDHQGTEATRII